ncbi:MAG: YtxH domain-containing protein [Candidatus Sericytochromatia bacterium]|uniref:YtxH domain-containing protein n=1 Tax=Candidatus Tanganyikabacteria bacterium TaxID=2961651 RepID=A0A937X4P7_9BACT|nr:YtxH domain-containing protein [Candidatus Tanganyikabacteria bacterium]
MPNQAVRSLKFVASALVGTAVGTVVGLLVAPKAGQANRDSIMRLAGELAAQVPFRLDDLKRKVRLPGRNKPDATFVQLYRDSGG